MIAPGSLAYYGATQGSFKPLRAAHKFTRQSDRVALLWGDEVYVIAVDGSTAKVSACGHHLELPVEHLTDKRVLSLYQIDCGQGDAALVNFPDGRWMMVDGGPAHDWSNSGKIAPLRLDALVCTHPDYDRYGGFTALTKNVRGKTLEYGTVYLDAFSARKRNPSLTRNGHSVVLRLDYGDVRILLTGDLNFRSQALLLGDRMVYGLINVRTAGKRIVMAVKTEADSRFQVEELTA